MNVLHFYLFLFVFKRDKYNKSVIFHQEKLQAK